MQIEKGKGARAEPWGPLTVTGQGNEEEPAKEREKPVMWEELGGQGVWAAKSEQRMSRTTERGAEPNKLAVDKPREMRMETWSLDLVTGRSLMALDQSRGNVTNTFMVE